MNTNPTQEERIIAFLQTRPNEWVPMPHLWSISGSMNIHSRISSLRKTGHRIMNKIERAPDGTKNSFYQLVSP